MYRKTKEERQAWWNSLSTAEQAAFMSKKEHERDKPDRTFIAPKLSAKEKLVVRDFMESLHIPETDIVAYLATV